LTIPHRLCVIAAPACLPRPGQISATPRSRATLLLKLDGGDSDRARRRLHRSRSPPRLLAKRSSGRWAATTALEFASA
jgi:hypothetical protein